MNKKRLLIIIYLMFFCVIVNAQNDDAVREFQVGLNLFDTQNYNDALQIFNQILGDGELNSRTTVAYLFKGKTLLKLDRPDEAIQTLNQLINSYPNSIYCDEARIVVTKCYKDEGKYLNAFEESNSLIQFGQSSDYVSHARLISEKLALNYLTPEDIKKAYETTTSDKLRSFLLLVLGKLYISQGNSDEGLKAFSKINDLYPDSPDNIEAKGYNATSIKNYSANVNGSLIGVMLPLFSSDSSASIGPVTEILEGIKFAVSQYNRSHINKIGLVIRDTRRSKDEIQEIANEFEKIPTLKTVLGPVFSDEVTAAAHAFVGSDIKIISPTATDNDLARLDNNIYQANPSFAVRGKTMADFIFYNEKKIKIGVINSNMGYAQKLADAFINEFEKIGGQVLTHQIYPANSIEIAPEVNNILPFANSLEGLYAPISDKNDATVILSSLVLDSLYLPMYGNQDWFLAKGLETSTTLSNNLTISTDYFIDFKDPRFEDLSKKFYTEIGKEMNRNVLYGYDAADYLLGIINTSNNDSDRITQLVNSGKIYEGYHNNLLFDINHVNKFLNFIKYKNGLYQLITRYSSIN
jgi:ABC-type branched-subunit amino acid transport system substrate-binding protein/predicted negative regulator of RcsB-dependent stress response